MIPFVKAHACGNDFLILEDPAPTATQPESLPQLTEPAAQPARPDHAALARRLCARSTGIGADGIEFLRRGTSTDQAALFLRLFNADGSEAELSGNGTRCVAAWLAHSEGRTHTTFGTHGGERTCTVLTSNGPHYQIESTMGIPRVMPRTILLPGIGEIPGAMVNVGNPHFVLFVQDPTFAAHGLPWQTLGARISTSPLFPHGTNVEFVHILSPTEIAFRIYERGCGPTTSSGTGTCASSAAAITLRNAGRSLTAIAEGGPQQVVWPTATDQMRLTGPAEILCTGEAL